MLSLCRGLQAMFTWFSTNFSLRFAATHEAHVRFPVQVMYEHLLALNQFGKRSTQSTALSLRRPFGHELASRDSLQLSEYGFTRGHHLKFDRKYRSQQKFERSFSARAVKNWNKLPTSVLDSSPKTFSYNLENFSQQKVHM